MRDIKKHSRMPGKPLAMKALLVNHLNFDGMAKYDSDILLVRAVEIPNIDPYTRRYFYQLSTITRSLPDQSQPISLGEYIN